MKGSGELERVLSKKYKMQKRALTTNGPHPHVQDNAIRQVVNQTQPKNHFP